MKFDWVSGHDLAISIRGCPEVRLVILQPTESTLADPYLAMSDAALTGLAQVGIPAVIAMPRLPNAATSRLFAETFYGALMEALPLDVAPTSRAQAATHARLWGGDDQLRDAGTRPVRLVLFSPRRSPRRSSVPGPRRASSRPRLTLS